MNEPQDTSIQGFRKMLRKQYMTVPQAQEALEQMLAARKNSGFDTLPPERAMAKEIHCSMMTLRRALEQMEKSGRIIKRKGVKWICDSARNLTEKNKISVVFLSSGIDAPGNFHYRRVFEKLKIIFHDTPVHFQFVGLRHTDTMETVIRKLELASESKTLPEIVVYGDSPASRLHAEILALQKKTLLIGLNEEYIGMCDVMISLNNFEAGHTAGRLLLESGAKNPVVIFSQRNLLPFNHRCTGFLTALAEAEISTEDAAYPQDFNLEKKINYIDYFLPKICKDKKDALFLFTDESSLNWYHALSQKFRIPEEFKLITLDASGRCRSEPQNMISAVSHCSEEIAQEIEKVTVAYIQKRPFQKIILIKPKYLPGTTL